MKQNKINAFSEKHLPNDISLGAIGGPEFNTSVITNSNGYEQRNINWFFARSRYDITPGIKTTKQLEELIIFFRVHKGKGIGFRFKDWNDYIAHKEIIAISDNENNKFQLVKTYENSNIKDVRLIKKPLEHTVKVYIDDEEAVASCDYTSGIITLPYIPKANSVISASFEFDVPVRFDVDYLPISSEVNINLGTISIIEIRV